MGNFWLFLNARRIKLIAITSKECDRVGTLVDLDNNRNRSEDEESEDEFDEEEIKSSVVKEDSEEVQRNKYRREREGYFLLSSQPLGTNLVYSRSNRRLYKCHSRRTERSIQSLASAIRLHENG